MMGKTQIKYPPCSINPMTEKPYARHKWIIPEGANTRLRQGVVFYRVRCSRCGINDPKAPTH